MFPRSYIYLIGFLSALFCGCEDRIITTFESKSYGTIFRNHDIVTVSLEEMGEPGFEKIAQGQRLEALIKDLEFPEKTSAYIFSEGMDSFKGTIVFTRDNQRIGTVEVEAGIIISFNKHEE